MAKSKKVVVDPKHAARLVAQERAALVARHEKEAADLAQKQKIEMELYDAGLADEVILGGNYNEGGLWTVHRSHSWFGRMTDKQAAELAARIRKGTSLKKFITCGW